MYIVVIIIIIFQIFLPLLLEYFTETELKALTIKVLELHNLSESIFKS